MNFFRYCGLFLDSTLTYHMPRSKILFVKDPPIVRDDLTLRSDKFQGKLRAKQFFLWGETGGHNDTKTHVLSNFNIWQNILANKAIYLAISSVSSSPKWYKILVKAKQSIWLCRIGVKFDNHFLNQVACKSLYSHEFEAISRPCNKTKIIFVHDINAHKAIFRTITLQWTF